MENGQAIIVHKNEEDEYVYPDEKWTENQPPQGIILPCYMMVKNGLDKPKMS